MSSATLEPVTIDDVLSRLSGVKGSDDQQQWEAMCPAHEDRTASLSVSVGDDGRILANCHAGCTFATIVHSLNLSVSQLMGPRRNGYSSQSSTKKTSPKSKDFDSAEAAMYALSNSLKQGGRLPDHQYPYLDSHGVLVGIVCRWNSPAEGDQKPVKIIRPVALIDGRWVIGGMPKPHVLYCLPEVIPAKEVFIVEGEKAADALRGIGLVATTSPHGAKSADKADWSLLAGKTVNIWPDNDQGGVEYCGEVIDILKKITPQPTVRVFRPDDMRHKDDAHDWVEQRDSQTAEELREALLAAVSAIKPVIEPPAKIRIFDVVDLIAEFPELRTPVVDGIMRRGETVNIIAKSKIGKSWLGYGLGLSISFGRNWLGFKTNRGRVLLIDNELHKELLSHRLHTVMFAMGIHPNDCRGWFDVIPLRGQKKDINAIGPILADVERDYYSLIICDALYRMLPDGTSEVDNAQMTQLYNTIDEYGEGTGAAFGVVHHGTKGSQSDKDITDVGSGAGAISRAADSHLILRPHEEADTVVLESKMRSFKEPLPMALRWSYPLWYRDDNLDPSLLKGRRPPGEERKAEGDRSDCDAILTALKESASTERALRSRTGFGRSKQQRLLDLLTSQKKVNVRTVEYKGKACEEYFAI